MDGSILELTEVAIHIIFVYQGEHNPLEPEVASYLGGCEGGFFGFGSIRCS